MMFSSSSRNCGPITTFTGVSVDRYVVKDSTPAGLSGGPGTQSQGPAGGSP